LEIGKEEALGGVDLGMGPEMEASGIGMDLGIGTGLGIGMDPEILEEEVALEIGGAHLQGETSEIEIGVEMTEALPLEEVPLTGMEVEDGGEEVALRQEGAPHQGGALLQEGAHLLEGVPHPGGALHPAEMAEATLQGVMMVLHAGMEVLTTGGGEVVLLKRGTGRRPRPGIGSLPGRSNRGRSSRTMDGPPSLPSVNYKPSFDRERGEVVS